MVRQSHEIVDKSGCSMSLFAPKSQNIRALKLKIKIHLPEHWNIITARDQSNGSPGPKTLCFSNKMTKNYLKSLCHLVSKGLLRPCSTSAVREQHWVGGWGGVGILSAFAELRFALFWQISLETWKIQIKFLRRSFQLGQWIFCPLRQFKFQGPCLNSGKQS